VVQVSVANLISQLEELGRNKEEATDPADRLLSDEERSTKLASRWTHATERVFKVYDLDDSGSIDFKELRMMLQRMYPAAHGTMLRSAIANVQHYSDTDGDIDIVGFQDARAYRSNVRRVRMVMLPRKRRYRDARFELCAVHAGDRCADGAHGAEAT
jgi:hypothetical protein